VYNILTYWPEKPKLFEMFILSTILNSKGAGLFMARPGSFSSLSNELSEPVPFAVSLFYRCKPSEISGLSFIILMSLVKCCPE
jgi:hypothetical protein